MGNSNHGNPGPPGRLESLKLEVEEVVGVREKRSKFQAESLLQRLNATDTWEPNEISIGRLSWPTRFRRACLVFGRVLGVGAPCSRSRYIVKQLLGSFCSVSIWRSGPMRSTKGEIQKILNRKLKLIVGKGVNVHFDRSGLSQDHALSALTLTL